MKEKRIPLILFGLLLFGLSFTLGYLVGNGSGETLVSVSSQPPQLPVRSELQISGETVSSAQSDDGLINLNTADRSQLETLPGIGSELADRILAYREENGPFVAKEQIMDVDGIGEVRYQKLEALITIGGSS